MERHLRLAGCGDAVVNRILMREHSRAQAEFLCRLAQIPLWNSVVLRCGAALNGIYTGARWSRDLDFYAPEEISRDFAELATLQGLPLLQLDRGVPTYVTAGVFYSRIEVSIDIYDFDENVLPPREADFVTPFGHRAIVRAQALPEIAQYKLWCVCRRLEAVDFIDLWAAHRSFPDCAPDVMRVAALKAIRHQDRIPDGRFDSNDVLDRLSCIRDSWLGSLSSVMTVPPAWEIVMSDLEEWLPQFNGMPLFAVVKRPSKIGYRMDK